MSSGKRRFAFLVIIAILGVLAAPVPASATHSSNHCTPIGGFALCGPDIEECAWASVCIYQYGYGNWFNGDTFLQLFLRPVRIYEVGATTQTVVFEYDLTGAVNCFGEEVIPIGVDNGSTAHAVVTPDDATADVTISGTTTGCPPFYDEDHFTLEAHLVTTSSKQIGVNTSACPIAYTHKRTGSNLSTAVFEWGYFPSPTTNFTGGDAELGREIKINNYAC